MEPTGSGRRYFVTIEAAGEEALHALGGRGLDLFRSTVAVAAALDPSAPSRASVGGLLSLDEAEALVREGYRVTLDEPAERRANAPRQVIGFEQWLRELEG